MMGEYIDRAEALSAISNWLRKAKFPLNASAYNRGEIAAYETSIEEISELPAADVVEVVRCKDCKYSDTFSDECEPTEFPLKCLSIRYGGVYQDWFCEHGRRREDGDADDKR